jgi:hypothetical protein
MSSYVLPSITTHESPVDKPHSNASQFSAEQPPVLQHCNHKCFLKKQKH